MKTSKQNSRASNKTLTARRKKKVVASSGMVDLSNDPYFVKKADRARELLIKYGVPKASK